MAVAYDNTVAVVQGFGATTLTTNNFTIGSNANRAAMVGLNSTGAGGALVSINCGGQSGSVVTGASLLGIGGGEVRLHVVANPTSGSQNADITWTNAVNAGVHVVTADGVDQSTPANNGNTVGPAFTTAQALAMTSANGDLTVTFCYSTSADTAQTTDQTQRTTHWACMDTGPGTANPTHTWSHSATNMGTAGANFKAAVAAAGIEIFRRRIEGC